ncbi:MAG TPA: hypothetical protein ENF33_03920, partial [Nitrososphaeria archaeon]|nr:hypothetical protein [Nitrososphaeria archaeon]
MRKLSILIYILLVIGLASFSLIALSKFEAQDYVKVRLADDHVVVETPLLLINFTYYRARVMNWVVKDVGVDLAAGVGYTDSIKRYPLWSWIPSKPWPGELCLAKFTAIPKFGRNSSQLEFRYFKVIGHGDRLAVYRIIKFYPDKYFIDVEEILVNQGEREIAIEAYWNRSIGYSISWSTHIKSGDVQAWRVESRIGFGKIWPWTRIHGRVGWAAIYNNDPEVWIGIIPFNRTNSLWLESKGWGEEVRIEFPAVRIRPGRKIVYRYRVFGGPLIRDLLHEAGFTNLPPDLSLRLRIRYDKYAYRAGEEANLSISLRKLAGKSYSVNMLLVEDRSGRIVEKFSETLHPHEEKLINIQLIAPRREGVHNYTIKVFSGRRLLLEEKTRILVVRPRGRRLRLVLVWHLHQPIYLNSSGEFESLKPLQHLTSDFEYDRERIGIYLLHLKALEKVKGVKVTFNVQPCLVYQWLAYSNRHRDNVSRAIAEMINGLRELSREGRVQLLTSPIYHPLPTILIDMGWRDDLKAQIRMGKRFLEEVFNQSIDGLWIPEMAFNKEVVDIMAETGLKMTILDGREFLRSVRLASGKQPTPYSPYIIHSEDGGEIGVLFRDSRISDMIGFQSSSTTDPEKSVRELLHELFKVYREDPKAVVAIALDGDNPFILGSAEARYLLEKMYEAFVEQRDWIETMTLEEAVRDAREVIIDIGEGSWAGGFDTWMKGAVKEEMWSK